MEAEVLDLTVIRGFQDGLMPDPSMTVSEWSDERRLLPETSAEPGRWKTSRTPYTREIMDKLSIKDPAQKVVVKKGSQVGFTEVGNNWVGYTIDMAPAAFLYIMPTDAMMKKTAKQRIEKMIEATPSLRSKIAKTRAKDSSNTLLYKEFNGGFITMVGANSPVGLSSTPIRFVYGDEIDRYPESVGDEGSAVDLADTRTSTYGSRRKVFLTSTPTRKGSSQIDIEFEKTGQRYYNVPCPLCGVLQVLQFEQLRYSPGKYRDVKYECPHCNGQFEERHKTKMLNAGIWMPLAPEKEDGYTFGYHLSAMYSPHGMYSWAKMAQDYEDAKGSTAKTIVFTNTKLGECYDPAKGEKPSWELIYERAEDYKANTPFPSVVFITAGVDVQADRLEIEIVGWMPGRRSQSLDYIVITGNTAHDDVWTELTKLLAKTWIREGDNAILPLRTMAVDTGFNTQRVYKFVQQHSTARVVPIKGRDKLNMIFSAPKSVDLIKAGKKAGKVKVWNIGVNLIKEELYGDLHLQINHETGEVPPGYCHFPKRETSYFRGLTAEEMVLVTNNRNFEGFEWVKKYKRNEPLDCRVYARAAASIVGVDRWSDERWTREASPVDIHTVTPPVSPSQKTKKSDFWK
ncbi:phage terminase large subunit family protein [Chitinophaga sp. sic0106]|uniref:phage terminase large subunit family protein n=1 Tax=Chitinophaga sp. sic0106 TaxID=2854785 RepID=UPI001C47E4C7|nr:phage terminase large subunit family protein [Chitinophaga sp. sic0106]MBV7529026.1 phage terminase large subunit family protein [Chitinophaga sp. sic0106]